jgi:CRP-like cAMP-binding protein
MLDQIESEGPSAAVLTALNRDPWFCTLSPGIRGAIVGRAQLLTVEAGAGITRRGDVTDKWVGVVQGALRLSTEAGDRTFTSDLLGPGQWFGDHSLIQGGTADLDMVAHVPSTVLIVPKAAVQQLMRESVEFRVALLQLSCQRLRSMYERCEERHALSLSRRLARQLQRLAGHFGRQTDDGLLIDVSLSQADLASMLGASRQRVNGALRKMHDDGIVRQGTQRLLVLDVERLASAGR